MNDIPEGSVERDNFCEQLKRDISVAVCSTMGEGALAPSMLSIVSIVPGSVIVKMLISAADSGDPTERSAGNADGLAPSKVLSELTKQLGDSRSALYRGEITKAVDGARSMARSMDARSMDVTSTTGVRLQAPCSSSPPVAPLSVAVAPTVQVPPIEAKVDAQTEVTAKEGQRKGEEQGGKKVGVVAADRETKEAAAVTAAVTAAAAALGEGGSAANGEQDVVYTFTKPGPLGEWSH
jgi:hypothetical protein